MRTRMINIIAIMLLLLVGLTSSINVCYAKDDFWDKFELLEDEKDYEEIKELEPQIRALINEYILLNKGVRNKEKIDLDMKKACKVHDASDLFTIKGDDLESIEEYLAKTDVVWVVFATCGEEEFKVQIARSKVLNDNPWIVEAVESVTEMDVFKYRETIEPEIKKNNIDMRNKKIILCSGLKNMNSAVAIVGNKKAEVFIPTGEIDIEGTKEQVDALKYDADIEDSYAFKYKKMKKALVLKEDVEALNGGVPKIILTDAILNDEDVVETKVDELTTGEVTTIDENKQIIEKSSKDFENKEDTSDKNKKIYLYYFGDCNSSRNWSICKKEK